MANLVRGRAGSTNGGVFPSHRPAQRAVGAMSDQQADSRLLAPTAARLWRMFSSPIEPRKAANLLRIATRVLVGIALLIALRGFFALFDGFASLNPFASGTFTFWDNLVQAWGTSIQTSIAALIAWCGSVYFDHVANVAERAGAAERYNAPPAETSPSIDPYAPASAASPPSTIPAGAAGGPGQIPGAGELSQPGLFGPLVAADADRRPQDHMASGGRGAGAPVPDSLAAVPPPLTVERPPAVEVRPQPEERAPARARQGRDDRGAPGDSQRRPRPQEDEDRGSGRGRNSEGRSRSRSERSSNGRDRDRPRDRDRDRERGASERTRRPSEERDRSRRGSPDEDRSRSDSDRPKRSEKSSNDARRRRPAEREDRPARRPADDGRSRSKNRDDGPADRPRRSPRSRDERPRRRPSNDT